MSFNYLTIDLESWMFTGPYLEMDLIDRKKLDDNYLLYSTKKILEILRKYKIKVTFFVLGELYEWYPELIQQIYDEGHEIAYHSHMHKTIYNKECLENSLQRSRAFLRRFDPIGFRAPEIFLPREALSVLKRNNFIYDSSVYGFSPESVDGMIEVPVSSYPLFSNGRKNKISFPNNLTIAKMLTEIPFGSGYYLALLGKTFTSAMIKKMNNENKSAVLFIHNWQIMKPINVKISMNFLKRILYTPYTFNLTEIFIHIIKNFKIRPIVEAIDAGDLFDQK